MNTQQPGFIAADIVSVVAIIGTFAGLLPPLAALGAIIWYLIQIYESDTVQGWMRGHRNVARRNRIKDHKHYVNRK